MSDTPTAPFGDAQHAIDSIRDYAIFLLGPDGKVASWNEGARAIKGYSASEILDQSSSRFYPQDDVVAGKPARLLARAAEEGRVEDDRDVREAIAEVLADGEYQPLHAANGAEALAQLRSAQVRPCVILLDVMMPTMDGWQFRAEQQRDPSVRDIPVVVLSAHADASGAAEKMAAAGYLAKPVALDSLLGIVERFCAAGHE